MKNVVSKVLIGLIALGISFQAEAYVYSFTNHTNKKIAIGMKYTGINEPLEQRIIPANERRQFRPGDPDISSAKAGFIVDKFFFIPDPILSNWLKSNGGSFKPNNINNAPWRGLQITWLKGDMYKIATKFAKNFGATAESAAKTAMRAAAASATGGMSEAAAAGLKEAADADLGLSGFVHSVGKLIAYSMAKDRHIDILEDKETGEIMFISLID